MFHVKQFINGSHVSRETISTISHQDQSAKNNTPVEEQKE